MAQRIETIVHLQDDIDGGKADRTVAYTWDGVSYEIDLSKRNATAFEKAIAPYLSASRRVRVRATRGKIASKAQTPKRDLEAIRAWAKANGYEVADRGRLAGAVIDAYNAAN